MSGKRTRAPAYYRSLGFTPYRTGDGTIPHRFDL